MTTPTFASRVTPERELRDRINNVILARANGNPRSKQQHIGPSEIGEECLRKLSYRLLDWPKVNTGSDPWAATCGTAIHDWLAKAFKADKKHNWLVEHKVTLDDKPGGSLDLFDVDAGMVIDHKCVGATSLKYAKTYGPTVKQKVQLNLYGYGLEQQGYKVNNIALMFYPFGGLLTSAHVWVGDYEPQVAIDALARIDTTKQLLVMLDPEANPERWVAIPNEVSNLCSWCPWFVPGSNDLATGCPGGSK